MIRPVLSSAALAVVLATSTVAFAQPQNDDAAVSELLSDTAVPKPQSDVADAFITAAKARNRQATLNLLAEDVAIVFPSATEKSQQDYGQGQAFVIGYLDGLLDAKRGLQVDEATPFGDAVRFLAHDRDSKDRYAIEVEVQNRRVVNLTVVLEDNRAVAALGPAS